jgi:hypothetical protein
MVPEPYLPDSADEEVEAMYALLAEISFEDWEDAVHYGLNLDQ